MPVHVGTSGWNYPSGRSSWNGIFYPSRRPRGFDELAYYAEHFDTVEVNSTFYRAIEPEMSAGWVRRTPSTFVFSVKLYQKFTHPDMYLARDGVTDWDLSRTDVDQFRRGLDPLAAAGRLGAVLVQFPPSFHAEPETRGYLEWLLAGLAPHQAAVELRHESWYGGAASETAALLTARGAAWVVWDAPGVAGAGARQGVGGVFHSFGLFGAGGTSGTVEAKTVENTSDPLLYLRLHGRNAAHWWDHDDRDDRYDYYYSPRELQPFADAARRANAAGRRVFLYLNNHFSAKAVANAAVLKHQLDQDVPGEYPREMLHRYPELAGIVTTSGLPL
jgi:uncharacterized protein YecE (DUF72 family)